MYAPSDPDILGAAQFYQVARYHVAKSSYEPEIAAHRLQSQAGFTESDLLREAAWVILCSGFRESGVRRAFDFISLCFCDWSSADEIVERGDLCVAAALSAFGHEPKIRAIAAVASQVAELGFAQIKADIANDPIARLQAFPFIGPVTAYHLAKNLGFNHSKPDRHLSRAADHFGFPDAFELCRFLARLVGETENVVDLVLWRYLASVAVGVQPLRSRLTVTE